MSSASQSASRSRKQPILTPSNGSYGNYAYDNPVAINIESVDDGPSDPTEKSAENLNDTEEESEEFEADEDLRRKKIDEELGSDDGEDEFRLRDQMQMNQFDHVTEQRRPSLREVSSATNFLENPTFEAEDVVGALPSVARSEQVNNQNNSKKRSKVKQRVPFGRRSEMTPSICETTDDHRINLQDFCRKLDTNLQSGLTSMEAERRLVINGPNVMSEKRAVPKWILFIKEFFTGFGPLYWIAALLCILAYQPAGGANPSVYNLALGLILIAVLILTSIFRFIQLESASGLMEKFMKMMPHNTKVLRNGNWLEVDTKLLVVGDVVSLTSGDKLPADVRVVEVSGAKVDKSSLTGETKPVRMAVEPTDSDINQTANIGFFGTNLVEGNMKAIIFKTGDETAMGQLAKLSTNTKRNMTTLERDIYYFSILIGCLAVSLCLIIVVYWLCYLRVKYPNFMSLGALLGTCVGVMVAFLPDGLAVAVTATLMMVAKTMRSVNVMVKDLNIIDTLGATTIICSDKTGTITQNKMRLSHVWMLESQTRRTSVISLNANKQQLGGAFDMLSQTENQPSDWLKFVLGLCGLCNNATIDETGKITGSSTEAALLAALNGHQTVKQLRTAFPMMSQIPFDSARKYQLNVHTFTSTSARALVGHECMNAMDVEAKNAKTIVIIKGGSEIIIEMCEKCVYGGRIVQFTQMLKNAAMNAVNQLADKGERVLGLSFVLMESADIDAEKDEHLIRQRCIFVGLVSLIDPPRDGVAEAVSKCRTAGVKVAMVTGDHQATAAAIARMVNIFSNNKEPLTINDLRNNLLMHKSTAKNEFPQVNMTNPVIILGKDLASLTDNEWKYLMMHREFVFARTTPENKMDIVRHFQESGDIVAATGDGVNDSAALKKADIGIAMGIMGSEISKDAANIILTDDNFASIVNGIQAGRLLFDNLRKVVAYLLPAGSFSEIMPVLANVFLGVPLPLSSFLMIVICVATDVCGALGMVHELPEADIMKRKPRRANVQHLVDYKVILYTYFQVGVIESFIAFVVFFATMKIAGGCGVGELFFAYEWGVAPSSTNLTNISSFVYDNFSTVSTTTGAIYCDNLDYVAQNNLLNIGQTAFFASLVICQCWNLIACSKTRKVSAFKHPFRKEILLYAYGELSMLFFVAFVPFFNIYLSTGAINYYCFLIPAGMGALLLGVEELRKLCNRRYPNFILRKIAW